MYMYIQVATRAICRLFVDFQQRSTVLNEGKLHQPVVDPFTAVF